WRAGLMRRGASGGRRLGGGAGRAFLRRVVDRGRLTGGRRPVAVRHGVADLGAARLGPVRVGAVGSGVVGVRRSGRPRSVIGARGAAVRFGRGRIRLVGAGRVRPTARRVVGRGTGRRGPRRGLRRGSAGSGSGRVVARRPGRGVVAGGARLVRSGGGGLRLAGVADPG